VGTDKKPLSPKSTREKVRGEKYRKGKWEGVREGKENGRSASWLFVRTDDPVAACI
jgi:hypothetical protein